MKFLHMLRPRSRAPHPAEVLDNRACNAISWSPQGRTIVLAGLKNFNRWDKTICYLRYIVDNVDVYSTLSKRRIGHALALRGLAHVGLRDAVNRQASVWVCCWGHEEQGGMLAWLGWVIHAGRWPSITAKLAL
jgi:hypothetical protein